MKSFCTGACPSGWISSPCQSCYKFVTNPTKTWMEAEGACRDMGGTLAVLDNEQKNVFIIGYMVMHGEMDPIKTVVIEMTNSKEVVLGHFL